MGLGIGKLGIWGFGCGLRGCGTGWEIWDWDVFGLGFGIGLVASFFVGGRDGGEGVGGSLGVGFLSIVVVVVVVVLWMVKEGGIYICVCWVMISCGIERSECGTR